MKRILMLVTVALFMAAMMMASALSAGATTKCGHSTPNEFQACSGGYGGGYGVGLGGGGGRYAISNDYSVTSVGGYGQRGGGGGGYCQRSGENVELVTQHGTRSLC